MFKVFIIYLFLLLFNIINMIKLYHTPHLGLSLRPSENQHEGERAKSREMVAVGESPSFGILGSSRGRNPGGERSSLNEEINDQC